MPLYISCEINNIAQKANFSNIDGREVDYGPFDGGEDGDYSGIGV